MKVSQHLSSLGKCILNPQSDVTSHLGEQLLEMTTTEDNRQY